MTDSDAPGHLRPETRGWFSAVVDEFELDQHHLRLLVMAAEAWDRGVEARETIAREGSYFRDRFDQPKAHPALAVERDCRISFARLLRELQLDGSPVPDSRLPRVH